MRKNINYDNDGLTTGIGRYTITRNSSNGLPESVADGSFSMDRTFNGYGELSVVDTNVAGNSGLSWNLTRNNNGQITSKSETVSGTTTGFVYSYDDVGRLLTVTKDNTLVEDYQYDANGNRTHEMNTLRSISNRTLSYSVEDHIIDAGDITYEFDLDDNLAARIDASGTTEYQYSSTGELMSVTLPGTTLIEYVHDPLGRRIAKKVNGSIVKKYFWSGRTTLLAVFDSSDTLLQRFEYADARMPYAMISAGSTYYLAYDQVGSLRLVTDTSGNTVKQIVYDSFGNILTDSNPGFTVPFGFAGGLHDRDTGLVRFGYRDYMPEIGKWTAKDPILFAGGDSNLYGYVLGDPVNWVDPWGLEVLVCNRGVQGFPFVGNHAYPWDTTTETAEGMRGSSGTGADAGEAGPAEDSCNAVEGSQGHEEEIMEFMRENQNNGVWFPFINDCHNAVQDAVENSGLEYPGAPGGRFGDLN